MNGVFFYGKKMIATHSAKMFNAKLKQSAICARIISPIPHYLLCSKNLAMERELWASPTSAADIKKEREQIKALPVDSEFTINMMEIEDTFVKQILLPYANNYVSVSPVPSFGLINTVYKRLIGNPFFNFTVQLIPAALANHGECLLMQGGSIRLFKRHYSKFDRKKFEGSFVQFTARLEKFNAASGMIAVGLPAISGIGGLTHALEREVGFDIEFAVGINNLQILKGVQKTLAKQGRDIREKSKLANASYTTDEIKADCEIVLLFRPKNKLRDTSESFQKIAKTLKKIHKIAGGDVFNPEIKIISDNEAAKAKYITDCSEEISDNQDKDCLDKMLDKYSENGEWVDNKWMQSSLGHIPNMTGYALLEEPVMRSGARNYPHAWAEPVFSLVSQTAMSKNSWWQRCEKKGLVFWKKTDRKIERPHFAGNDFAKKQI